MTTIQEKKIKLTKGKYALVDDADFEWLNQWKWWVHTNGHAFYAARTKSLKGKKKTEYMHRIIIEKYLGFQGKESVDHINHDTLDNRKQNLRKCTTSQNSFNRGKTKSNTSGEKGVSWHKTRKRWEAMIKINKKVIHLGRFKSLKEAKDKYDEAAKKYHGEFLYKGDCLTKPAT